MNDLELFTSTLDKTKDLWNAFRLIPENRLHVDDNNDFKFHLHALQNILLSNIGQHHLNTLKDERKA